MKKLAFVLVMLACMAGVSYAADYYYLTTDMTWAEFYAGEIGKKAADISDDYDAVSTATVNARMPRMVQLVTSSTDEGSTYYGVKAVQVRMTEDVYNALSSDKRYTLSEDATFTEYKDVDVSGNFSAMVTDSIDISKSCDVSISYGGHHSQYTITTGAPSITSLGLKLGEDPTPEIQRSSTFDYYLGGTLTTNDNKVYGLKHLSNLWINIGELGFAVSGDQYETNSATGGITQQGYKHTSDLQGKTITQIRFMLKNQPDVVINCEAYIPKRTDAAIEVTGANEGNNVPITLAVNDAPDDASYSFASVAKGTTGANGRTSYTALDSSAYTYTDGTLTITGDIAAGDLYQVTFTDDAYIDVSATFTVKPVYYATTNMTFAEFYAGEFEKTSADLLSAGLDAVSAPTTHHTFDYAQAWAESEDVDGTGTGTIYGMKDVHVRMTEDVYNVLSGDDRYTFEADGESFDFSAKGYKEVNEDGTFGALTGVTAQTDATGTVTVASGTLSRYGNYTLTISTDAVISAQNVIAVIASASNGNTYGLQHNSNLWAYNAKEVAFTVVEGFTESHGATRPYKYTQDLEGATITGLTYYFVSGDTYISQAVTLTGATLKKQTNATVAVARGYAVAGENVAVTLNLTDSPTDANYSISVIKGVLTQGRRGLTWSYTDDNKLGSDEYSYSNGVLTMNSIEAGDSYRIMFTDDTYIDLSTTLTVRPAYQFATTDMTYAEFYAGEFDTTSAELLEAGLDAVSTPTKNHTGTFAQVDAISDDSGSTYSGIKAVHVRMTDEVYNALSGDTRYTFSDDFAFTEYKEVNADGKFGALNVTPVKKSATVTISYGGHQQYVLNTADSTLAERGSGSNLLAGIITVSGDKKFGMRHIENLWARASQIGFAVSDFIEASNKDAKDYDYTSGLEGQTVTNITYYFASGDEYYAWTYDAEVLVKYHTDAAVTANEPADGWLEAMTDVEIPITWTSAPDDAAYTATVYSVQGRAATELDSSAYSYADGVLTMKGGLAAGSYRVTFTDKKYFDVTTNFTIYTTNATSKIISGDNDGGLQFLLTPAGAVSSVDKFVEAGNYVNADAYVDPTETISAVYAPDGAIEGSGFSFDITLHDVPSGKTAVVGFSKAFTMTASSALVASLDALPDMGMGYRVPDGAFLKAHNLQIVAVYADGTSRDITDLVSMGMLVSGSSVSVSYGTMLADRALGSGEGADALFSPEGERLNSDGAADGHLRAAWYFATTGASSQTDGQDYTPNDGNGGGGTTYKKPDITAQAVTPTDSTLDVTVPEVKTLIVDAIKAIAQELVAILDGGDVDVVSGFAEGETTAREAASVSDEDLADMGAQSTEALAAVLPEIKVSVDKVVTFKVPLNGVTNLKAGWPIFWHAQVKSAGDSEFRPAEADETYAVFFDGDKETKVVPESLSVDVAAFFEADKTYAPVVTASEPVTTNPDGNGGNEDNSTGPGDSSGGCNAMDGFAPALMLAVMMLISRKK